MANRTIPNRLDLRSYFHRLVWCGLTCIVTCTLMATTTVAQKADSKPTLVPGSEVSLSAIKKADWLQGEAPTAFEPGKVYVFECWATWCGPCVALIPHVNELHKKYYDKGLRVHGMNCWEDDREKADNYVKAKGKGMSYPVAFTNESAFETEWLEAAGVEAIPHAFVVRNGKLLLATEAVRLTDSLVELMLSGDEGAKQAAAIIKSANDAFEQTEKLSDEIYSAYRKQDAQTLAAKIKEVETLDPGHPRLSVWKLQLLMVRKQWPVATTTLTEMPFSNAKSSFVAATSRFVADSNADAISMDFVKAFIPLYAEYIEEAGVKIGPSHLAKLAILYSRVGDKENAIISAEKGVEAAINNKRGASEARTSTHRRFAKSVKEGVVPGFAELISWQREAQKKAAAAAKEESSKSNE